LLVAVVLDEVPFFLMFGADVCGSGMVLLLLAVVFGERPMYLLTGASVCGGHCVVSSRRLFLQMQGF
jgi:hypothetical protein